MLLCKFSFSLLSKFRSELMGLSIFGNHAGSCPYLDWIAGFFLGTKHGSVF